MRDPIRSIAAASSLLLASAALAAGAPKKTPELVAKGKASYEVNCASCHGDQGKGDGPAADALEPKPRNLVTGPYKQGAQPAQVFASITNGVAGTTMAPFGHLSEEERWGLAYYVLQLRGGGKAAKK